jgi:hypothetical protein
MPSRKRSIFYRQIFPDGNFALCERGKNHPVEKTYHLPLA